MAKYGISTSNGFEGTPVDLNTEFNINSADIHMDISNHDIGGDVYIGGRDMFATHRHRLVKFFIIENPAYRGEIPIRNMRLLYNNPDTVTKLGDLVQQDGVASRQSLSLKIPELVQISETPDAYADIPDGWHNSRYRVLMIVESIPMNNIMGEMTITYLQGYTNAVSELVIDGEVNMGAKIHINSAVTEEVTINTNDSAITFQNEIYHNDVDAARVNELGQVVVPDSKLMRPNDIFRSIKHSLQNNSTTNIAVNYDNVVKTMDSRSLNTAEYGSALITPYLISSTHPSQYGGENIEVSNFTSSTSLTNELDTNTSPFLAAIASLYGLANVASFTIGDVSNVVENEVDIIRPSSTIQPMTNNNGQATANLFEIMANDPNATAPLKIADMTTRIATTLANVIRGHMMTEFISIFGFTATNKTPTGEPMIAPTVLMSLQRQATVANQNRLLYILHKELWNLLSTNNLGHRVPITITATANLFGDTFVGIELSNNPIVYYRIPTMASAKISPVIGNTDKLNNLTNETVALLKQL